MVLLGTLNTAGSFMSFHTPETPVARSPCETGPPRADIGACVVGEDAHARPHLALVDLARGGADAQILGDHLVVDEVPRLGLDSWVDHPDALEAHLAEVGVEFLRVGELRGIEREDAVTVHVVDVEPDDVAGDVARSEPLGDLADARLGVVGIAALVVAQGPPWRQGHGAGQPREHLQNVLGPSAVDHVHRVWRAFAQEHDAIAQVDGAAPGRVGQNTEGRAVGTHRQHPRVRLVERRVLDGVAVGIGVPTDRDSAVAQQRACHLAGAVETGSGLGGDASAESSIFVHKERRRGGGAGAAGHRLLRDNDRRRRVEVGAAELLGDEPRCAGLEHDRLRLECGGGGDVEHERREAYRNANNCARCAAGSAGNGGHGSLPMCAARARVRGRSTC